MIRNRPKQALFHVTEDLMTMKQTMYYFCWGLLKIEPKRSKYNIQKISSH